jgi:diguanylate cyclase (GGDEF)-like protein
MGATSPDPAALRAENRDLRATLRELKEAAARNEALLRKSGERELELLRAASLEELFDRLLNGLRTSYQLDAVALALHDPRHEIRHLALEDGSDSRLIAAIQFVDFLGTPAPSYARLERPWLGPWRAPDHAPLFGEAPQGSVALIPLPRRKQLDGVLGFASADPTRFSPELASDFLAHLGVIAAICVENAVNRARLVRAGLTDYLTGWNNRRYLQTRLAEELARAERAGSGVACMMIDVDHFKRINDLYGHLAGDAVLREVAQRIDSQLRQSDARARFGGDEFAVVLPGTGLAGSKRLATRVLDAVAGRPVQLGAKGEETITLSIGLASLDPPLGARDHRILSEQLVAQADAALYQAKSGGRNAVFAAEPMGSTAAP